MIPPRTPHPSVAAGDARLFGRNFASAAFAQLVTQVLTLAASIFLARKLDVSAYGVFVFGFAFPSWFLLLVSLGLDDVIATQVAADRSKASRYLTLVGLLRLLLAVGAIAALWAGTLLVLDDPFAQTITLILGASSVVSTYAGTFSAVFRAFERLEYGALVTIVERTVTVGIVILQLSLGRGLYEVSLTFLGGSFVALLLPAAICRRKFAWFSRERNGTTLSQTVRLATPFALFNAVGTFTYSFGLVLLMVVHGPVSAGLFNASFTLLFALFAFLNIVSLTTLPMMSRINHESKERLASVLRRVQRLSLIGGIPLAFGGAWYAEEIITTFYGPAFRASFETFRILLVSFAVETAVMGIGPALAATGHAKQKLYVASGGAAVTVVLSVLWIPGYGPMGAAYAFLASRFVIAVFGSLAVRRYIGPVGTRDTIAKSLLAGTVMLLVLVAVPGLPLWTGIPLGGLVYFAVLWALHGASHEDRVVVWDAIRGALFR